MRMGKILDNIEIKLICLVLAVIMWFYANKPVGIMSSPGPKSEQISFVLRSTPVVLAGSEEGETWVANPSKISLEVVCRTSAEIDIADFKAIVKLPRRNRNRENYLITLTAENVELPKGLIFVRAEPKELLVSSIGSIKP